jgi:Domain of unknown function (DUF1844)
MSDDKKIIIDEDWKSQVAAEKEAAQRQREPASGEPPSAGASGGPYGEIPASFDLLVTTFVTEAMVALGQLPHPANNQLTFDPAHARFAIDMLEIITEKTQGNLTPQEDRGLQDVLHQLRMAFVAISNQQSAVSQKNVETREPSSG